MFRPTVEQLEQREVYSVNPASAMIHAANPLTSVSHVAVAGSQNIAVENDEAHFTRHAAGRTESVGNNETITINGNVGKDGVSVVVNQRTSLALVLNESLKEALSPKCL